MKTTKPYLRWLKKLAVKKGSLPEQITFFVTNECNLRCQHCFFWKKLGETDKELSLEEIEKISKTVGQLGFLSLTGGEPFLRKDLPEIAALFCRHSGVLRLSIPTNGVLTETVIEATEKILKKAEATVIVKVSLDALGKDHDRIRGRKGSFEKAVRTYRELKKLKRTHRRLRVGVLMTIFSLNQKKIDRLYDFVRTELKPDHVGLNLVRGDLRDNKLKGVSLEDYQRLYQRILADSSRKRFFYLYKKKAFDLLLRTVKEDRWQTDCFAGTLSGVIYANGDVFPCESLNKRIGNLRNFDGDFKKLWLSERAEQIRDLIKKSKCFCRHECNLPLNIFFNFQSWPGLLKDAVRMGLD